MRRKLWDITYARNINSKGFRPWAMNDSGIVSWVDPRKERKGKVATHRNSNKTLYTTARFNL